MVTSSLSEETPFPALAVVALAGAAAGLACGAGDAAGGGAAGASGAGAGAGAYGCRCGLFLWHCFAAKIFNLHFPQFLLIENAAIVNVS